MSADSRMTSPTDASSSLSTDPKPSPTGAVPIAKSCITCQKRKVKCNRERPCSNCSRSGSLCSYSTNTKRRPRGPGRKKLDIEHVEDMRQRVARLESLLRQISKSKDDDDASKPPSSDQLANDLSCGRIQTCSGSDILLDPPSSNTKRTRSRPSTGKRQQSTKLEPVERDRATQLLESNGKSLYISNAIWTSLSEEVADLNEMLAGESGDSPMSHSDVELNNFIFQTPGMSHHGDDLSNQPVSMIWSTPWQAPRFWSVFKRSFDTVFHVINKIETEDIIRRAGQPWELNRSEMALYSSICFAAINSMPDNEINTEFGTAKLSLSKRFRNAAENALARADLMNTTELRVLQGFVIYIICLRRCENARHVWMLVGIAIRIALSLGLHRDGERHGLSPSVTEVRRRLWWQLYILEVRVAEDQGCNPTLNQDSFDTRLPLNVNDEDLNQAGPLEPRKGITDTTIGIYRLEAAIVWFDLKKDVHRGKFHKLDETTLQDQLQRISNFEQSLEEKYQIRSSVADPRVAMAELLATTAIEKLRLSIQNPFYRGEGDDKPAPGIATYGYADEESRRRVLMHCICILEGSIRLQIDPQFRQWAWTSRKYVHWHPVIIVLTELCHRPFSPLSPRLWKAVHGVLQDEDYPLRQTLCDDRDTVLWRLVLKLIAKATQSAIPANSLPMQNENMFAPQYDIRHLTSLQADAYNMPLNPAVPLSSSENMAFPNANPALFDEASLNTDFFGDFSSYAAVWDDLQTAGTIGWS